MPDISYVILWQSLSFNEFSLRYSRVFSDGFHHCNAVILKIVVDGDRSNSVELIRRFMNSLFEVGVVSQHLKIV